MIEETISHKTATPELMEVSLVRFVGYFLRLGTFGFGGPIALAGHMQQDLVEDRHWISKQDYVEGLALAQLAPGPLAAQLAIYLGYVRNGILGATAVAIAFVLPSFLMVLALSAAYVRYGGLSWMQAIFYGIGACGSSITGTASLGNTHPLFRHQQDRAILARQTHLRQTKADTGNRPSP